MTHPDPSLDAEVRRAEPDLWLSSRLVSDPAARAALVALYGVHIELSKIAGAAKTALAGEIRLAWWREETEALAAGGRALGHPTLQAMRGVSGLDYAALDAMIEARHAELEPRPFADEAALLTYLDGVDGALMRAAYGLLAGSVGDAPLTQTARAWGWTRLMRERSAWRSRARDWTPAAWGDLTDGEIAAHARHRVAETLAAAKPEISGAPVSAFPAVAHATLVNVYARGRHPSDLERRIRLLWASLRGRI
jgi:phytoene synthase